MLPRVKYKGWFLAWLSVIVALLVALPAQIFFSLVLISIVCLFATGFSFARGRFIPAILTVAIVTATISSSPLGSDMFDASSYEPIQNYRLPPEVGASIRERMRSGAKPVLSELRELYDSGKEDRIPAGTHVNYGIFVMVGMVALAYLSALIGAGIGIRNARKVALD